MAKRRAPKLVILHGEVRPQIRWAAVKQSRAVLGPTGYEGRRIIGGYLPPPDHRRCVWLKRDGERCRRWSTHGAKLCVKHHGRKHGIIARAIRAEHSYREFCSFTECSEYTKMFYTKYLSKTLQDKLHECLQQSDAEQTQLLEELALTRTTVLDVAQLYDSACRTEESVIEAMSVVEDAASRARLDAARDRAVENKVTSGALLREAIKDIADLCDKIEKHRVMQREKTGVSVHAIAFISKQMVQLAYQVCGDNLELAQRFEQGVRHIRLPETQGELVGTLITPDQDVLGMDSTVPLYTEISTEGDAGDIDDPDVRDPPAT